MTTTIFQINVKANTPRQVSLPKMSVDAAIISKWGLEGDYNKFRKEKKKNDPDMAVMILSTDILEALNNEGWPVNSGDLGENLTLTNIDYNKMKLGDKLEIGEVRLEISLICDPCTNLNNLPYVGKEKSTLFIKTLMKRRGWYARVLKAGKVIVGDSVSLTQ
ncbi:MAG: MOSC domain-containing protein [Fidelibacterota bacterium]|jgi:MOSC domain-containing protein YiiM|nr:MOSC domain-containing protein [Candidatus Neomarinimicrobiota bacterium]|tara:strand:- start:1307 stop:1792 length:486 start_codon:yes stop_codon:yes gene_type:complete